tara:strand:- start:5176 stop:6441 length:1266 start_codon:yes stop_codon:yes gene_type:complete
MEHIITNTENFDFTKLSLSSPSGIQGGSYFTKLLNDNNPIYLQCPSCKTKQGIVNSGRKVYSDIILTKDDNIFIDWLEKLEEHCHGLILDKSEQWFENPLDLNDIESSFISPIKSYKSGSLYILKCSLDISKQNNKPSCVVYDENENSKSIEDVASDVSIIPLIHINGIKFSSKNFQLDIIMRQVMLLNTIENTPEKLIKKTNENTLEKTSNTLDKLEINQENSILVEQPIINESSTEEPSTEEPPVEEPSTEEPPVEEPSTQEPPVEEPSTEEPAVEEPSTEEPAVEEPSSEEPAVEEPSTENTTQENHSMDSNAEKDEPSESESEVESEVLSDLEEFNIDASGTERIHLKDKAHIYYQIYHVARDKLKNNQKQELLNYFNHKEIDTKLLLDDLYETDEEFLDDSDNSSNQEESVDSMEL